MAGGDTVEELEVSPLLYPFYPALVHHCITDCCMHLLLSTLYVCNLYGCLSVQVIAHALMLCVHSLPVFPLHTHMAASLPVILIPLACCKLL